MEAWGRPKEGTANAKMIRRRAGGKDNPGWVDWTEDQLSKALHWRREYGAIAEIRDVELLMIAEVYQDRWAGRLRFIGDASLGVAQIQLAVAAMVLGMTTWREKPPALPENKAARAAVDQQVEDDWKLLTRRQQVELYNHLRFPKSNIALCARLLGRLKGRPSRAPTLPASAVAANAKLVGLIATEFQAGATTSAFADATIPEDRMSNAQRAIRYVRAGSDLHPEVFFP